MCLANNKLANSLYLYRLCIASLFLLFAWHMHWFSYSFKLVDIVGTWLYGPPIQFYCHKYFDWEGTQITDSECYKFVTVLWWPWLCFHPATLVFWSIGNFSSRSIMYLKFFQPYLFHGWSVFPGLMYLLWTNGSSRYLPPLIFVHNS